MANNAVITKRNVWPDGKAETIIYKSGGTVYSGGSGSGSGSGTPGTPGKDGVGIAKIEQTQTSTVSSGVNIVTVTLTDASTSTFQVRNGSVGSPGSPGKSAYQSALDTGYVGSESEWVESLQGEPGRPGSPGSPGVPGQSAYEMAVAAGFTGDEAAWLESLKGKDGAPGAPGAAAGFGTPTAEAFYIAGGDPTAEVTASGPDTAKKFAFKFWIPKASEAIDTQGRLNVRPRLYIARGNGPDEQNIKKIVIYHPLLTSNKYEAVLMVYRRLNKKKTGISQVIGGGALRLGKKGWFTALGDKRITDHAAFAVAGGSKFGLVRMEYDDIRDFIVKRFMTDNAHTKAELWSRNYAQWAAEDNVKRGFGYDYKARKKFGIAIRYVNPAFTALVNPSKPLSPTTMELIDSKGNAVPRYIYSDVAPLTVELQNRKDPSTGLGMRRAAMWFGVSE